GPVGQFAILSAKLMGAGHIFAIDTIADRLAMARGQGAEVIDYNVEDPVETIKRLTGHIGVDRVIDAVGVDANHPDRGPAAPKTQRQAEMFQQELQQVAPKTNPQGDNWHPGDAPSQVSQWSVQVVAKGGTISIIGVYPPTVQHYPIGKAMNKNLHLNMGNCNHRKYIPSLIDLVQSNIVEPLGILTQTRSFSDAVAAYKAFDVRQPGWTKVELVPSA
ncbi:MAG TPA: zinc-binding dehydrogenase, partial [Ktedonobacteraceae bacterium]|nr:zinc-binding dehydrogenase [Ktedonobacteraceae bacterium]